MRKLPTPSRNVLLVAIACAVVAGCGAAATVPPTHPPTDPPPSASPTPGQVAGGTITLADDGCTWADNPRSASGTQVTVELVNETDDYGVFFIHRLKPEFSWQDGVDAIAAIQVAHAAGDDWPNWATNVSIIEGEAAADAGGTAVALIPAMAGTFGVVCSASTSASGDILTIYLAGPLEIASL